MNSRAFTGWKRSERASDGLEKHNRDALDICAPSCFNDDDDALLCSSCWINSGSGIILLYILNRWVLASDGGGAHSTHFDHVLDDANAPPPPPQRHSSKENMDIASMGERKHYSARFVVLWGKVFSSRYAFGAGRRRRRR